MKFRYQIIIGLAKSGLIPKDRVFYMLHVGNNLPRRRFLHRQKGREYNG